MLAGTTLALAADPVALPATPYLDFVRQTVDRLLASESVPLGDEPGGVPFLAVSATPQHAWTSVGMLVEGKYQVLPVPAQELEARPGIVDFQAWPLLEQLSRFSGDPRYRTLADNMAAAFAQHGFHPRSGLLQIGAGMYDFDIRRAGPVGGLLGRGPGAEASFKPSDTLPWTALWAAAPEQMARFCQATFVGLVTRPADFRFNRYVHLDFDSRQPLHEQAFNPQHRGFLLTGAMLIKFWSMHYQRTGDPATLAWAMGMARQWQAHQHPETGLLPHFIGADAETDTDQIAVPFANSSDVYSAVVFLETAESLADNPAASELVGILRRLGTGLARGIASHAYNPAHGIFEEWLKLGGGTYTERTYYTFRDQAAKDAALAIDPAVAPVEVFAGPGFYWGSRRQVAAGGTPAPGLAQLAAMTRDPLLLARCRDYAAEILRLDRALPGEFNDRGQWTYPVNGAYLRLMLHLHEATGEAQFLDHARELADRALARLAALGPEQQATWWRLPHRTGFLRNLLELHAALLPGRVTVALADTALLASPALATVPAAQRFDPAAQPPPGDTPWRVQQSGLLRLLRLDPASQFSPGARQYAWADAELAKPFVGWTVVLLPVPLFTASASGGFNERWHDLLTPLLERHQVDLLISAGGPDYLRTTRFSSTGKGHAVQTVVLGRGPAGAPVADPAAWVARTAPGGHALRLTVTPNELQLNASDAAGQEHDRFTLSRRFPALAERPWASVLAENLARYPTPPTLTRQELAALTQLSQALPAELQAKLTPGTETRLRLPLKNPTSLPLSLQYHWETQGTHWQLSPASLAVELAPQGAGQAEFQLRVPAQAEQFYPLPTFTATLRAQGRVLATVATPLRLPNRPLVTVPRRPLPGQLTGQPSADLLARLARVKLSWGAAGEGRQHGTQAWLGYDATGLYLAVDCPDPQVAAGRRQATQRDDAEVWQDDCVELLVDSTGGGTQARQFIVSLGGVQFDTAITQVAGRTRWQAFDGTWRAATHVHKAGWQAELLVPWSDLGLTGPPAAGTRLGLSLSRLRRPKTEPANAERPFEYHYWAVLFGPNTLVPNFGSLLIGE